MIRRLSLVLVGVVAAAAVAEASLALFWPQPFPGYALRDGAGHRLYDPSFELGIIPRTSRVARTWRADSDYALILLGDSFMGSHLAPLLSAEISRSCAPGALGVIRAGVAAIGTGQELTLYRAYWRSTRGHFVLLEFYLGDDVLNNEAYSRFLRQRTFLQHSQLYRLLSAWRCSPRRGEQAPPDPWPPREAAYRATLAAETDQFRKEPRQVRDWATTFDYLRSLAKEVRLHGGKLGVVIVPRDLQVEPAAVGRFLPAGETLSRLDLDGPNRILGSFLAEEGIPALDLLPLLREEARKGPLYDHADFDIHWNQRGDMAATEAVAAWLKTIPELHRACP